MLSHRHLKFVVIHALFLPNQYSQNFRVHIKMFFFKSGLNQPLLAHISIPKSTAVNISIEKPTGAYSEVQQTI